ncbi:L-serine ammonia-lyase [Corynebacterium sp.]|uniref:L-serine ammonia-lyase n=1 Tax=Corynebacterium sp. TaxID=1720 RepID=UPI0028AD5523|nr:L-serine ammonia-lyase [Corynebacterium sp.]
MTSTTVYVSALDLFSIGIGPSSSHTVGPMRAGADFAHRTADLPGIARVSVQLYGSLSATGRGHGTPDAVVAGLRGAQPETCDPDDVRGAWSEHPEIPTELLLDGRTPVLFSRDDVVFNPASRDLRHPNTMVLQAWTDDAPSPAVEETYLSIGGGFIERVGDESGTEPPTSADGPGFRNASELLALCTDGRTIADVAWAAECTRRSPDEVTAGIDAIWAAMRTCVDAGLHTEGVLPGRLHVRRRAAAMRRRLEDDPAFAIDEWLHVYALAVNEENAGGGRVVTAPTNGAAGIIPAVLHYWWKTTPDATDTDVRTFLLTAAAVGSLIKANASISGAEGGCQAEVGSACAMAAAGFCAVRGGTAAQVENAAEIAVEHHLGLTCDPIGGLVQIPCIERNAVAASTAVTAARLALAGDGSHVVSLDAVIQTMRETGADMNDKYKETSRGGLAVNVVEC